MNKIKSINGDINICGISLQGFIDISYAEIVKKLGFPGESDQHKVDAEWEIEFEDGTVATIYNYKDGKNYLGENGLPVEQITNWNIGGFNNDSVKAVYGIFRKND